MEQVLFATTNEQKVKRLSRLTPVKLISLTDISYQISEPKEAGMDALEISIFKARHYWSFLREKIPVLTQDDSLKLEVEPEDSPGNHIKAPVIKKYGEFTDRNAILYYNDLAKKYGGFIPMYFEYGHAVCFEDGGELMVRARKSKLFGRIVTESKENDSTTGYFLAAIMQVRIKEKWKYYSELTPQELVVIDSGISESLKRLLV